MGHQRKKEQQTAVGLIKVLGSMAEVILLGAWPIPFSRRVEMALKLKGIDYEYIEQYLANKSSLLLEYNPVHKQIPVLVHNGKPIAESLVILEHLDETWKANPILPQDPYERAMARFWAKFIDEKCIPTIWQAVWTKDQDREKTIEEACQHLKTLENELKGKKFFGGDAVGMLDIVSNFLGYWLGVIQEAVGMELMTRDKFPVLCKWMDDYVISCPAIKDNLPPREKLLASFKARFCASS